jgi:hypothetical protein
VISNNLQEGQYMLTPLQGILLNKLIPRGFKLETEENMLKALDQITRTAPKRQKSSVIIIYL